LAGIKDASDKKILVDMLIWAIDNPPPANYLLISGDRDFSNALHKLKMRQYNILLAQPPNVSQALTAAAKSVWLWKSFVAGEPQLAESPHIISTANGSADDLHSPQNHVSESSDTTPPVQNSIKFDEQKAGNGKVDKQYKVKQSRKIQTDNVFKSASNEETSVDGVSDSPKVSAASQPNHSHNSSSSSIPAPEFHNGANVTPRIQPFILTKKPVKPDHSHQRSAPHDFYHGKKPGVSTESTSKNGAPDFGTGTSNCHPKKQKPQSSRPARPQNAVNHRPHGGSSNFQTSNTYRSNSSPPPVGHSGIPTAPLQSWPSGPPGPPYHGPPTNYPDMNQLNISEYPRGHDSHGLNINYRPSHPISPHIVQPGYGDYNYRHPTPTNMSSNMQNNGYWGVNPRCTHPSPDPQGLVRHILSALEVLKAEKIPPTEQSIADCICYGDANLPNFDVKMALQLAMQQQAVIMKKLGNMPFYLGKNENLWNCVNIMDDNAKYPKETFDAVHRFISSAHGYSAMMNSQSR
jgi:hypothetical protein